MKPEGETVDAGGSVHRRAEILFPKFQLRRSYNVENLLKNSGASSLFSGLEKETLRLVKVQREAERPTVAFSSSLILLYCL